MSISSEQLKHELSVITDSFLARQLVDSYVEMQQRYSVGDWRPSELDGGHFCEAIARALYQIDSGIIRNDLLPGDISNLLRSKKAPHNLEEKDRDHFCRVLLTTYKFRNDRDVAHISPIHDANLLDATLIIATVKWMFCEFLRLAWKKDRDEAVAIIESIVQLEHPLIHELDGQPLVLSNELTATEEILILLQHSQSGSYTKGELKQFIYKDQSTISNAITRLKANKEIRINKAGEVVITTLGTKHVHTIIMPKLSSLDGKKRGR